MESQSRCFPYEKSIVINALYDTIDALGLSLDSANSSRGTLIVSDTRRTGSMRIALSAEGITGGTQVSIYPEVPNKCFFATWHTIIFDELSGTIKRARCTKRETNKGEVL